jgi:hypothetical protein
MNDNDSVYLVLSRVEYEGDKVEFVSNSESAAIQEAIMQIGTWEGIGAVWIVVEKWPIGSNKGVVIWKSGPV